MFFPAFNLATLFLVFRLVVCDNQKSFGDVNIAVIFSDCDDSQKEYRQIRQNTAEWIVDRLNVLRVSEKLKVSIQSYQACRDDEFFDILFEIFKRNKENYYLGIISDSPVSADVRRFAEVLQLTIKNTMSDTRNLMKGTASLLDVMQWNQNLTVFSSQRKLVDELYRYSSSKLICIKKSYLYKHNSTFDIDEDEGPHIILGESHDISNFLSNNQNLQNINAVLVPTDGLTIDDVGEMNFLILPTHIPLTDSSEKVNLIPSSTLLEISQPILSYTEFLKVFLRRHCNETQYKLNCLKYKQIQFSESLTHYTNEMILGILKIETLKNNFLYDVYKAENDTEDFFKIGYHFKQPLSKLFTYNIFDGSLSNLYQLESLNGSEKLCIHNPRECESVCENYRIIFDQSDDYFFTTSLDFRTEPWVLVFSVISAVGVLLSVIILAFLFICIYRKNILEGNPITTVFLLFTVLLMYCSVLIFTIKENVYNKNTLCMFKSLWTTLSVCAAFSLILSRSIMLSTVTKEIAYMSHIPGSVQSFMFLFMVGIQVALSLQLAGNNSCSNIFEGASFVYLMSYNIMLLLLILCLSPMIYNSQRNYKEGKFFTVAATLITICWCFWISCYKALNGYWKDPLICFAMVSTALILQTVIFLPRTYLMITASFKNKLSNNIPRLNDRHDILDTYRVDSSRRVYDCINVAAINAISVATPGVASTDLDEDIYNYPTLPRDEEINFDVQSIQTNQTDKVTRF